MSIPPGFIDELRSRISVSEIVSKRVKLIKKGREHSGLCPFHNEKTPSFTVNDDKGFYHCFGCGAHGSALDFVMNTQGLNFPEAVEMLAGLAGMDVPKDTPEQRERTEKRKTLHDVVEQACQFYERNLRMPAGRAGLDYLKQRGLDEATIKRFRLGYGDANGGLIAALRRDGIDDHLMIDAGLLIKPDDLNRSVYERFRDRVMFPITDRSGRVIAFGGRILGDGKPKYLNSPETALFHKGSVLYGLAQAREKAHKSGEVIVCEGYMDVIALARGGFDNAVAPLGTALTEDQIRLLWRMSPAPILCFDGDSAGQRAALRAAERALPQLKAGYTLKFATLPSGVDPDDLLQNEGTAALKTVLEQSVVLSEFLWRDAQNDMDLDKAEDRALLEDRLKTHAFQIENESVRSHFLSALKDRMWAEIRKSKQSGSNWKKSYKPYDKTLHHTHLEAKSGTKTKIDAQALRETLLLAAVVFHPQLLDEVGERLGLLIFNSDSLDKLRQEVLKTLDGDFGLNSNDLQNRLRDNGYSEQLGALLNGFRDTHGAKTVGHGTFLLPERPLDEVLRGWNHTFHLYMGQRDLQSEFRALKKQLKTDFTPENWNRFQAHQKLMGSVDPDENEVAGLSFGIDDEDLFD